MSKEAAGPIAAAPARSPWAANAHSHFKMLRVAFTLCYLLAWPVVWAVAWLAHRQLRGRGARPAILSLVAGLVVLGIMYLAGLTGAGFAFAGLEKGPRLAPILVGLPAGLAVGAIWVIARRKL